MNIREQLVRIRSLSNKENKSDIKADMGASKKPTLIVTKLFL